ncbi:MAG: hypothetical protein PHQ20_02570 [Candidatus Moranbacteria bacterium]|nr:hypothetical protein [Candidatus Moranbacteria bacterium]
MKKNLLVVLFFLISFFLGTAIKTKAGTEHNLVGWLWGGSEDANSGTTTGVGWVSINNIDQTGNPVNGSVNYGVNIPQVDGNLSGYAWSENLGWISFNEADLAGCPDGAACTARRIGNNLAGWARVLSIKEAYSSGNSGGWQGFIDLSNISINGDALSGYGWNGETAGVGSNYANGLGWIDFNGVSIVNTINEYYITAIPTSLTVGQSTLISWSAASHPGAKVGYKVNGGALQTPAWGLVNIGSSSQAITTSGTWEFILYADDYVTVLDSVIVTASVPVPVGMCNGSVSPFCEIPADLSSLCLVGSVKNNEVILVGDTWNWICTTVSGDSGTCSVAKQCNESSDKWREVAP